ncbi:MAG: hypothetical protein NAG76_22210 [Candidatus Pristimantibacillus lignocellulolyticus]|uniref:Uncharacterized protein n=1 Tax=Candidatus Pristimantibacillus lignocellulolyticus TaxID=2994561 RepID=A0A9J6ZEB6_9BACL|nr:MAG: hypothetical protein NAG76_22210 [Candidatus Pristimantibacillus lignocellulolyticus]
MSNENNVGISEISEHRDRQISIDEIKEELKRIEPSEPQKEESVAEATPPLTANSNWKALYRDIANYAKTLRQTNDE